MTTKINLITKKQKVNSGSQTAYSVNIGGIVKIFGTEPGAHRFLVKNGYVLQEDCTTYTKERLSDDEINLHNRYVIFNHSTE